MTKKVKISVSSYLVYKIVDRAKELSVILTIEHEDLDYAELQLFGDNAHQLAGEIESGNIFLKMQ